MPSQHRDPETGSLWPRDCRLYVPGHSVHWIQGLKAANDAVNTAVPGEVVEIGELHVVVKIGGDERIYRNHETHRLAAMIDAFGRSIRVQESWHLLSVPHPGGGYLFSIDRPNDAWVDCVPHGKQMPEATRIAPGVVLARPADDESGESFAERFVDEVLGRRVPRAR